MIFWCRVMREAQEAAALPSAVPACSAVEVRLSGVPDEAAVKLVAHMQAFGQVQPHSTQTVEPFQEMSHMFCVLLGGNLPYIWDCSATAEQLGQDSIFHGTFHFQLIQGRARLLLSLSRVYHPKQGSHLCLYSSSRI